jgi:hypothetical protein
MASGLQGEKWEIISSDAVVATALRQEGWRTVIKAPL